MAQTRPDRDTERNAALACLRDCVAPGAIAIVCWFAPRWPPLQDFVRDLGLVDLATVQWFAAIGASIATVLAAIHLLRAGSHLVRWRSAVRWERQLEDPARAHLVPPLARHTRSLRDLSAQVRAVLVGSVVVVALLAYLGLAAAGLAPRPPDQVTTEWGPTALWLLGLFVLTRFGMMRVIPRWRRARTVERLSVDPALAASGAGLPAEVATHRAARIPTLDVVFGASGPSVADLAGRPGRRSSGPLDILYLRLFDNVDGTAAFLGSPWRTVGFVHLLRSAGQVAADELRAARAGGSPATMFITTPDQLAATLAAQPTQRHDPTRQGGLLGTRRWLRDSERGRYPTRALLCHGSFWQQAVDLLLDRMDLVVLDLSGYRPENTGTRFELQRLVDRVPFERVMFLAESSTDQPFLTAQLRLAWSQMASGSPNAGVGERRARVAWLAPPTGFRLPAAPAGSAGRSTRTGS
ncbi:hypothetical protein [Occultella kanbiaonis]|uniref:hypothetical protein n=1 Tax=Occultella kanbiaonis TaxID=2675754 RepID=UPI0012B76D06|nr:hypothetical protein [Occultella kanbiaonis]